MAFLGYLRWDGVEIVNNARLTTYTETLGLTFFDCGNTCGTLPDALEARQWKTPDEYRTPRLDKAPWVDSAEAWGDGFAGVQILDAVGFNSSMWEAQTNQALLDGGFVSRGRFKTREITFRALLVGVDLHAVQHGLNWLSTVLHRGDPCADNRPPPTSNIYREITLAWSRYKDEASIPDDNDVYQAPLVCETEHNYRGLGECLHLRNPVASPGLEDVVECEGSRMEFFIRCPDADTVRQLYRYHLDAHCTSGPTLISSHEMDNASDCDPGAWAEVEFTVVAANPFAYRLSIDLAKFNNTLTYGEDYTPRWAMYKNALPVTTDNLYEHPLRYLAIRHTYAGVNEAIWTYSPVTSPAAAVASRAVPAGPVWVDPSCPPVAQFPGDPADDLMCAPLHPGPWTRSIYQAGTDMLPKFTEAALLVDLTAVGFTHSDVRVRFVPQGADLETGYDAQFHVTHLPDGATMRIDGRRRSITMFSGTLGGSDFVIGPASHLVVLDASAASYTYPTLICGGRYSILVDVPDGVDPATLKVGARAVGREG